jgi:hypothetical protein
MGTYIGPYTHSITNILLPSSRSNTYGATNYYDREDAMAEIEGLTDCTVQEVRILSTAKDFCSLSIPAEVHRFEEPLYQCEETGELFTAGEIDAMDDILAARNEIDATRRDLERWLAWA